jgi:hypothetical protein
MIVQAILVMLILYHNTAFPSFGDFASALFSLVGPLLLDRRQVAAGRV